MAGNFLIKLRNKGMESKPFFELEELIGLG